MATHYAQSDIDAVIAALAKGATLKAAVRAAGVSWTGFYEHMDRHPEVKLRVQTEKARIRGNVENSMYRASTEPRKLETRTILKDGTEIVKTTEEWTPANVKAGQIYLYNTAPEDWREAIEAVPPDSRDDALARRAADLSPEEHAALRERAGDAIFAPASDVKQ